jgi:hypothetical protein
MKRFIPLSLSGTAARGTSLGIFVPGFPAADPIWIGAIGAAVVA